MISLRAGSGWAGERAADRGPDGIGGQLLDPAVRIRHPVGAGGAVMVRGAGRTQGPPPPLAVGGIRVVRRRVDHDAGGAPVRPHRPRQLGAGGRVAAPVVADAHRHAAPRGRAWRAPNRRRWSRHGAARRRGSPQGDHPIAGAVPPGAGAEAGACDAGARCLDGPLAAPALATPPAGQGGGQGARCCLLPGPVGVRQHRNQAGAGGRRRGAAQQRVGQQVRAGGGTDETAAAASAAPRGRFPASAPARPPGGAGASAVACSRSQRGAGPGGRWRYGPGRREPSPGRSPAPWSSRGRWPPRPQAGPGRSRGAVPGPRLGARPPRGQGAPAAAPPPARRPRSGAAPARPWPHGAVPAGHSVGPCGRRRPATPAESAGGPRRRGSRRRGSGRTAPPAPAGPRRPGGPASRQSSVTPATRSEVRIAVDRATLQVLMGSSYRPQRWRVNTGLRS